MLGGEERKNGTSVCENATPNVFSAKHVGVGGGHHRLLSPKIRSSSGGRSTNFRVKNTENVFMEIQTFTEEG
jgi:hypothetical protein